MLCRAVLCCVVLCCAGLGGRGEEALVFGSVRGIALACVLPSLISSSSASVHRLENQGEFLSSQ